MDGFFGAVYNWIWNEEFWFPPSITWKDFENKYDGVYIPETKDLLYVLPVAAALTVLRCLFERYVARPFGLYCGVPTAPLPRAVPNTTLEQSFFTCKQPTDGTVKTLAVQIGQSERQIQRWFRRRRNQDRPSAMTKFTETAWRFTYYLVIFFYGLGVLWNKPWFSNTRHCWYNYPVQSVTSDLYWYYMVELAFYVCLFCTQFIDVKRKDFKEQFVHHVATIFLMWFSWSNNFVRIGSLVLCTHDAADFWLEGAKLAKYSRRSALCDKLFACFTFVWLLSRLIYYPFVILWSTVFEAVAVIGYANAVYFYNFFLVTLQILHLFWFFLIAKIAYRAIVSGQVEKDVRSASEESEVDKDGTEVNHSLVKPHMYSGNGNGVCHANGTSVSRSKSNGNLSNGVH